MVEGTDRAPKASNTVLAHYSGWLTDGRPFDSSHKRGTPAAFPLARVVPGWTEDSAHEGGSAAIFVIPAELGYGNRSTGIITPARPSCSTSTCSRSVSRAGGSHAR